jgi:Fic family protein
LALFDLESTKPPPREDIKEVWNYQVALDSALGRLKDLPVCKRLIREAHKQLMTDVRGGSKDPGNFRRIQHHIGTEHSTIETARFVPPPFPQMVDNLDELEFYIQAPHEPEPLIKLALIHYQFETIHPFMDGNGRIGRLLITLLLCHWKLLRTPLLYMSSYFEKHGPEYRDLLLRISQQGAWLEWVEFFLRGVIEQSKDAAARAESLLQLRDQYRQEMQISHRTTYPLMLIDNLFINPAVRMEQARQLLRVTPVTAKATIDKLVTAGILEEVTGRRRDRIYIAPGIIDIIEKDSFD